MATKFVRLGPIQNALGYDDSIFSEGFEGTIATITPAETNHSVASYAEVKSALDALGQKINEIITALG